MDKFDDTVAGGRLKQPNNSHGKFSGEEDNILSSSGTRQIQSQKDTKHVPPKKGFAETLKKERRSILALNELSLQRSNEKIEREGNTKKRPDDLMSTELDRLHKLKLEVIRANEQRRKSYAGFRPVRQERRQKLSVWGERLPTELGRFGLKAVPGDNKDVHLASETQDTSRQPTQRRRRITLTLPIERENFELPQIQQPDTNCKEELKREANDSHESVAEMQIPVAESESGEEAITTKSSKSKQVKNAPDVAEHFRRPSLRRYGSPLPQVQTPWKGCYNEASQGPEIMVSDYVDLNIKVATFVKKSQPRPSEKSLRTSRSVLSLPSVQNTMKKKNNKTIEERRPSDTINTDTCPSMSFYEDRSWYYQDKRRKCRYLRMPDSPVPPINSVFEKD